MATLKEDIKTGSNWISTALKSSGYKADFSPKSLKEIDRFFNEQSKDGKPTDKGLLSKQLGNRLFCIGSYIGEVIRRKVGGEWITNDSDPQGEINITLKTPDGTQMWPVQRVMKRLQNGAEDSIAAYGSFIRTDNSKKPFWKFW
jgi:hypothetical protein